MTAHTIAHVTAHVTPLVTPRAAAGGRAAAAIGASLMLALAVWGTGPSELAAQAQPKRKPVAIAKEDSSPPVHVSGQGIVVIVNDDAITAYEIEQRARLNSQGANISEQAKANFKRLIESEATEDKMKELQREVITANPGKSREELIEIFKARQKEIGLTLQKRAIEGARATLMPKFKKDAREELIDDRLKLQAAKKVGIEVTDDDVKEMLKGIAERNKLSYDGFAAQLKGMGLDISSMGEKFRAQRAWRDLVGRKFGMQISISQRDIDQLLATVAAEAGQDAVELQVQKLSLAVAAKADQTALTRRLAEAESLRRRFAGCKGMAELVKGVPDARLHETKLMKPSTIAEPTRSLLLGAKDDEMLPPVTTGAGIDLYAVCGRRTLGGDESLNAKAKIELQNKQLDIFGQRYLRNLRQEANIEYK